MCQNDNTSKENCQEVLRDVKNGKVQPWKQKKATSMILADSLYRLEQNKKANRVWWCACELAYETSIETGEERLKTANFCRERLCPMCQWRRSKKVFYQVSRIMNVAEQRNADYVPIFLTLTVKNCIDSELSGVIGDILSGWRRFNDHRKTRKLIKGWFRALEVTYDGDEYITEKRYNKNKKTKKYYDSNGLKVGDKNLNADTFHPHIHAILLVDKSYFKGEDYMYTSDWAQLWRASAGLDYTPTCHIRKVKSGKRKRKEVAEVAKYTLKDSEYLTWDEELTDKLVSVLGNSLKGRRLYAFGGVLKKIAKELNAENPDEGDLVNIDEESIREDVATVINIYHWNFGLGDYYKEL